MSGENQALTPLGLDEHEEELYRLLVDRPGLTLVQCEGLVDASTAAAFPGLAERLVARGLLIQEEPGPTFRASPPALALGPLVAARQEELQQVKATVATLADHFRASHTVPPGSPVEVVLGREAVAHRFLQLQLAARREILGMMPVLGDSAVVASDENTAEADAIRRGVRYHVVYRGTGSSSRPPSGRPSGHWMPDSASPWWIRSRSRPSSPTAPWRWCPCHQEGPRPSQP